MLLVDLTFYLIWYSLFVAANNQCNWKNYTCDLTVHIYKIYLYFDISIPGRIGDPSLRFCLYKVPNAHSGSCSMSIVSLITKR